MGLNTKIVFFKNKKSHFKSHRNHNKLLSIIDYFYFNPTIDSHWFLLPFYSHNLLCFQTRKSWRVLYSKYGKEAAFGWPVCSCSLPGTAYVRACFLLALSCDAVTPGPRARAHHHRRRHHYSQRCAESVCVSVCVCMSACVFFPSPSTAPRPLVLFSSASL